MVAKLKADDEFAQFSQSFLDVIACAFGAVVLLVLILPIGKPEQTQIAPAEYDITSLEEELVHIQSTSESLSSSHRALLSELEMLENSIASMTSESENRDMRLAELEASLQTKLSINEELRLKLDEQKKVGQHSVAAQPTLENQVFGIPVDSDYVIFVVDTSGSMQEISVKVANVVRNILSAYPELSGIQVISDQGERILGVSSGLWIQDSRRSRALITSQLKNWKPYSNSSPIEGVQVAMESYVRNGQKTAVIILGDDYTGSNFDVFLRRIELIITQKGIDEDNLRVHAIGFENERLSQFPERFGMLMRALTYRYNGFYLYVSTSPVSKIDIGRGNRKLEKE